MIYRSNPKAKPSAKMVEIIGQMRAAVDRERLTAEQARLRMRSRVKSWNNRRIS